MFHAVLINMCLMEENRNEAILVNVVGSKKVADKCIEYGVDKMVMISTDKAVNPTSMRAVQAACRDYIRYWGWQ